MSLTEKALYFVLNCIENEKYLSKGRIPVEEISENRFCNDSSSFGKVIILCGIRNNSKVRKRK